MTFAKGYVVTIRQNGQTLKETQDGKVPIKFHTEYQIRLRNKTRQRAVADVYIDGRLVAEGVVVNGNDYLDLERFVEKDLKRGECFKFVPLEDHKVEDKNEPDNGKIDVTFYPEKEPEPVRFPEIHEIHHHHHSHHHCHQHWCWHCGHYHCDCVPCWPTYRKPHWDLGEVWCRGNTVYGSPAGGGNTLSANVNQANLSINMASASAGEPAGSLSYDAGATVRGSRSNQEFRSIHMDVDRSNPVTIHVQLIGYGDKEEKLSGVELGKAIIEGLTRFCPGCRASVIGGKDKFCRLCGASLTI